ncbi:hypothetical protein ElyMa_006094300 [Elysia marginata]|uniref:Uncharacterized protein n=1 Tax=Elysia marginata TaxID=1093978 RepID=A0AAV4GS29_9GAST|nr:hypothetical protein ElyMa_006094300 [Elysia marginata]
MISTHVGVFGLFYGGLDSNLLLLYEIQPECASHSASGGSDCALNHLESPLTILNCYYEEQPLCFFLVCARMSPDSPTEKEIPQLGNTSLT